MSEKDRESGHMVLKELFGRTPGRGWLPEEFFQFTVEHLFGRVWTRPELAIEERSLLTVAILACSGNSSELHTHLKGARNLGIPRKKLEELMIHVAHYAGWPSGVHGLQVVDRVFQGASEKANDKVDER